MQTNKVHITLWCCGYNAEPKHTGSIGVLSLLYTAAWPLKHGMRKQYVDRMFGVLSGATQ